MAESNLPGAALPDAWNRGTQAAATTLTVANAAAHVTDVTLMAAVPLAAVVLYGADAQTVGRLLAVQSLAWLLLTLPGGVWVDRAGPSRVLRAAAMASLAGAAGCLVAVAVGSIGALGAAMALATAGLTLTVLATVSAVQQGFGPARWSPLNARMELARAIASIVAPLVAGALLQRHLAGAAFGVSVASAAVALIAVRRLPAMGAAPRAHEPVVVAAVAAAQVVARHPVLRPIALCAVLFNLGFFAAMAVWVPYAVQRLLLDPSGVGLTQAGYGVGLLLGAAVAPRIVRTWPTRAVLVAGPGGALAGALLLWAFDGLAAGFVAQALFGLTPVIWLVCTITLRQRLVAPEWLGRVGAMLQLAVYGVRPLGALAGGAVAQAAGLDAAIAFVAACMAASAAIMLFSGLRGAPAVAGSAAATPTAAPAPAPPRSGAPRPSSSARDPGSG
jgi:predicted MFS family arabinose efflux permease